MVKQDFTINAAAGYNALEEQDAALSLGNAFAGVSKSYDTEMWNAIHNQAMSGDDAFSSSISQAQGRSSATAGDTAKKREKEVAERSRQVFYNAMMQEHIRSMRDNFSDWANDVKKEIGRVEEQINALDRLRDLVASGSYDPENAEHAELYAQSFPGANEEDKAEFDDRTMSGKLDIVDDTTESAENYQSELNSTLGDIEEAIEMLDSALENGTEIPMENGQFLNPLLEEARQNAGLDIVEDNLTTEILEILEYELKDIRNETNANLISHETNNEELNASNASLQYQTLSLG